MKPEIISMEFGTIEEAEAEFLKRKAEGCWQLINPLKVIWSWKSFDWVVRFSMKKVEKAYHLDNYLKDLEKCASEAIKTLRNIDIAMINKRKATKKLNELIEKSKLN